MNATDELRVVVVEDTPLIVDLVGQLLALEPDVSMTYAGSDAAALMRVDCWRDVDVALVDLRLPGVPGEELLDWLAENVPSVRRLAMSACGPMRLDAVSSAHACLLKPFLAVELVEALRSGE